MNQEYLNQIDTLHYRVNYSSSHWLQWFLDIWQSDARRSLGMSWQCLSCIRQQQWSWTKSVR